MSYDSPSMLRSHNLDAELKTYPKTYGTSRITG